jgi:hypothetical protein
LIFKKPDRNLWDDAYVQVESRSAAEQHCVVKHVVRSITSRFVLTRISKWSNGLRSALHDAAHQRIRHRASCNAQKGLVNCAARSITGGNPIQGIDHLDLSADSAHEEQRSNGPLSAHDFLWRVLCFLRELLFSFLFFFFFEKKGVSIF